MPTYEYVCQKCGHEFEIVRSMMAPALTTCPKDLCGLKKWGKGKVKKSIGAGAGLIFKGSGFYITDYRSEGYKAAAKKESSAGESKPDAKAETKAEAKAESKPAAKPAAKGK
jgi:putative FmdB family regulatory protein